MAADYTSGTASERLAAVRAAIQSCLLAQSYSGRQRTHTNASLPALMALEARLIKETEFENAGGRMMYPLVQTRPT